MSPIPPGSASTPSPTQRAITFVGSPRNHLRRFASSMSSSCTFSQVGGERVPELGDERPRRRPRTAPSGASARTRAAPSSSSGSRVSRQSGLREPPRVLDLLDVEVPADREVDDRRRDVEHVRPQVDQRAHLPGPESSGGANSTGASVSASPIGTASSPWSPPITWSTGEPDEAPVAAGAPHPRPISTAERRPSTPSTASAAPGRHGERPAGGPPLLQDRRGLGDDPLRHRHHDREPLAREQDADRSRTARRRPVLARARTARSNRSQPWKQATCSIGAGHPDRGRRLARSGPASRRRSRSSRARRGRRTRSSPPRRGRRSCRSPGRARSRPGRRSGAA